MSNASRCTSRSLARVLTKLGIDFAILGAEERHDGDSMLRAGEEGLFEMLAEQNIETLNKYEFDVLLTTDPHAFNAFLHENMRLWLRLRGQTPAELVGWSTAG